MKFESESDGGLIASFFGTIGVALEFDIDIFAAEDFGELVKERSGVGDASLGECVGERTGFVSGKADEACGAIFQFVERGDRGGAFWRAELGGGDQSAEILISGASCSEERVVGGLVAFIFSFVFGDSEFGSDVRFDFGVLGGEVETWRSVEAVVVEEGYGWHAVVGASADEGFGQGSAFQKAESRAGVEFDIGHGTGPCWEKCRRSVVASRLECAVHRAPRTTNDKKTNDKFLIKHSFDEPLVLEAIAIDAIEAGARGHF